MTKVKKGELRRGDWLIAAVWLAVMLMAVFGQGPAADDPEAVLYSVAPADAQAFVERQKAMDSGAVRAEGGNRASR